jgi:hypothetical protein
MKFQIYGALFHFYGALFHYYGGFSECSEEKVPFLWASYHMCGTIFPSIWGIIPFLWSFILFLCNLFYFYGKLFHFHGKKYHFYCNFKPIFKGKTSNCVSNSSTSVDSSIGTLKIIMYESLNHLNPIEE